MFPILLVGFVDFFSFIMIVPLLPFYAERFGASPVQVMMLLSIYAVGKLFSSPVLGRLSDRVGRKPLLLVSQAGTLVALVILARADALWMLFIARGLDGSTAGNISLAHAYLADSSKPQDRAKVFSLFGVAIGLALFLGPLMTGMLVVYGYSVPIYLAAGLSFASIVCTAVFLPNRPPVVDARRRPPDPVRYLAFLSRPVLGPLLLQTLCFGLAFSAYGAGLPLFCERRLTWGGHPFGAREVGLVWAYSGLVTVLCQATATGWLVRRFGEPTLVRAAFILNFAGYTALALVHTPVPLVVLVTITTVGDALLRPGLNSLVTRTSDRSEHGVVLGLIESLSSVAQCTMPLLAGLLIGREMLPQWAFLAGGAGLAGVLLAHWGSSRALPTVTANALTVSDARR